MKYNPYILTVLTQLIEIAASPATNTTTIQKESLFALANTERAKVGLKPLIENSALNKLAVIKSKDMVENNYFSHTSPNYGSVFNMMIAHGISYFIAGENLAINQYADDVHTAWMNSKTHRENILNSNFREIGIGIYRKGNNSYAYTQLFIA